ncbi:MAG: hypothetical protein V3V28_10880 [Polaribacter sp.]|uniref:hypothetical protein n=1 Tax=Polaribacter sp. TaxID=1920175 RepID=UPI002F353D7D
MKTKILLILTLVTFLSSCETNNNAALNITSADLIGTWNLKSQIIEDGSLAITTQGQTLTANYSAEAKNIDFRFIFSDNPTKLNLNGKYTFVTTASFLGQNQVEEQEIDTDLVPITSIDWALNGNAITITENGNLPTVLNVEEFSTNYLKLKGEVDQTETDNGESVHLKATIYIELEK